MDRLAPILTSPALPAVILAAGLSGPLTGFATWPALARGRFASTVAIGATAGVSVFLLAERLAALGLR